MVKLAAAALGASAELAAVAERTGIDGASGLAFDAAGNLWVASSGPAQVIRVDASHLGASGPAGDLSITARSPAPSMTTLPSPSGLAFDGSGALWVNYDGTLAKLSTRGSGRAGDSDRDSRRANPPRRGGPTCRFGLRRGRRPLVRFRTGDAGAPRARPAPNLERSDAHRGPHQS